MKRGRQVMPKVDGQPFRCEVCGANVFTEIGLYRYACNGCAAEYVGTPK